MASEQKEKLIRFYKGTEGEETVVKLVDLAEAVQRSQKFRLSGFLDPVSYTHLLCKDILGEGLSMSVASFRADSVTKELVDSLAESGLKTLTMAPEAGSDRMRAVINKGIEEHHLFHSMDLGLSAGIRNFRLYIMVGLPFEQEMCIRDSSTTSAWISRTIRRK